MAILDEKGRLFGKINVIDFGILVVVVLVLLAAARFTILRGQPETTYVQVEMNDVPPSAAASITPGATGEDGRLRVTDVREVDVTGGAKTVFVKVRVDATRIDGALRFDGDPLAPGSQVDLEIDGTTLPGQVVLLDDGPELVRIVPPTARVFIAEEVPYASAASVENGTTGRFDDGTIFEVRSVVTSPLGPTEANVYATGNVFRLSRLAPDAEPVVQGSSQTLLIGGTRLTGTVQGAGTEAVEVAITRTPVRGSVEIREDTRFPPGSLIQGSEVRRRDRAGTEGLHVPEPTLRIGASETVRGRTLAELTDFVILDEEAVQDTSDPASDDGHPFRAQLTFDLLTVDVGGSLLYKGEPVTPGRQIVFQGSGAVFPAVVTAVDPDAPDEDRTAEFLVQGVPPWVAEEIDPGDIEGGGAQGAHVEILDVTNDPATVTVTTADGDVVEREHPRLRDLQLTARLRTDDGDTFKGEPLVPGTRVLLRPDRIPIRATVTGVAS